MGIRLAEDTLRDWMNSIAGAADDDARIDAVGQILSYLSETETLEVWGRSLARRYGRTDDHEELTSVLTEGLLVYLRKVDAETVDAIASVAKHLFWRAKTAVVTWLDSPAVTVASEMSTISRRHRQALVARGDYYLEHGREPSDAELVQYANEKTLSSRKDAAKQSALLTVADVSGRMLTPYSMNYSVLGTDAEFTSDGLGLPTTDASVKARGELSITVRRMGDLADELFGTASPGLPSVREVMGDWMEQVLIGETPTISGIARRFGINRDQARVLMSKVEHVLARLRTDRP